MKSILAALALIATASASAVAITSGNSDGPVQGSSAPATAAEDRDIEEARRAFLEDEVAPRVEPAAFDTTIVMYTDYQCPYCRKAHVALKELLSEDSKVRILYRDWPIFGPASERAARLAIASKWQGRHSEFHDALMLTPGKLSDENIRAAAKKAGVDWAQLESDLKTHGPEIEALLQRNDLQANALGLDGTPGFIIGETLVPGGIELAGLREMLKDARAEQAGKAKTAAAGSSAR